MPEVEKYEVMIMGSGEAGKYLAWTMGKAGYRTATVERKLIGGSCPITTLRMSCSHIRPRQKD